MNTVKLYSNGLAVISRDYNLDGKPQEIRIPVRNSDLADVVSTISVFGNVSLPTPPSYEPTNSQQSQLSFDSENVNRDIYRKLTGSKVTIGVPSSQNLDRDVSGILMGIQTYQKEIGDNVVVTSYDILIKGEDNRISSYDEGSIKWVEFEDTQVQSEIDKALKKSFARIKPESTFVDLVVVPQDGADSAKIVYAVPVAAWKPRYQLRMSDSRVELEGQAIVDNDTDDDWRDVIISVVTGEPITFSTDLAEIRRPIRQRKNLVADYATGAFEAAPDIPSVMNFGGDSLRSCSFGGTVTAGVENRAKQVQAEIQETGDFSIFTSPNPVTVLSERSAIVPLFLNEITDSQVVLVYRQSTDPERPYRAMRITNNTEYSLSRGVCEIFEDGELMGKSILNTIRPGEDAVLVHARETGVRVHTVHHKTKQTLISVKIHDNVFHRMEGRTASTDYKIVNVHSTEFTLEIEHECRLIDSLVDANEGVKLTEIPNGFRATVTVPANSTINVTLTEKAEHKQEWSIKPSEFSHIFEQYMYIEHPFVQNENIQRCLDLQRRIQTDRDAFEEKQQHIDEIKTEQERLNKLLPNASPVMITSWHEQMIENEKELKELKEIRMTLSQNINNLRVELEEAVNSLSIEWNIND